MNSSTEETEIGAWDGNTIDREKENDFNVSAIPHDPGLRINILDYNPNNQDVVRREYMKRGPCRPRSHKFPQTKFGVKSRRFNPRWFNKYDWLEYSIEKDTTFYLPVAFDKHVKKFNSVHKQAREKYDVVNKLKTSIQNILDYRKKEDINKYRQRLRATLRCLRYLLHQGLAIRGHDETEESSK
ncbi:zinc finger MYM-type protein 1-like protein [Tanacetum coccineum]